MVVCGREADQLAGADEAVRTLEATPLKDETSALYGPEAGGIVILPDSHHLVGGLSFGRNSQRCDSRCAV